MGTFLSYLLYGFAITSIYIVIQESFRKTGEKKAKYLFISCQLGSAAWSLFFGFLIAQTDAKRAADLRIPGMIGMFAFLIFATLLYAIVVICSAKKIIFKKKCIGLDIFLYLCALEFLPLAILWRAIHVINAFLTTKI